MLAGGRVRVNGTIARRADTALAAGDVVEIAARGPRAALPPGLALVYEDGDVIVVDKPAGLLTIATERERERTVYAHLTARARTRKPPARSEEHTSELQSRFDLVCRLLLEKKKKATERTK